MSFRFRSFLIGIIVASLTWILSLYFYSVLNSPSSSSSSPLLPNSYSPLRHLISNRNRLNQNKTNGKWKEVFNRILSLSSTTSSYRNSQQIIKELQSKVIHRYLSGHRPMRELNSSETQKNNDPDLSSLGLIRTIEEKKMRDEGYKNYAFNSLISSRLSYHRNIPDTRHEKCSSVKYPSKLPSASIIICFYNEEINALFRTVHSVLDRSNAENLHEIILVDDFSDIPSDLHEKVKSYGEKNWPIKVRLLKTPRREGLIRARIFGAKSATGDVLVFLDSHVEANVHWLEPLLAQIKENSSLVVTPIIDVINPDSFVYAPSPLVRGGFNWGLHFKWDNVPKDLLKQEEDFIKPIMSPAMAGGLFAMNRTKFFELGSYDEGMEIWGSENIEISIRLWTCGYHLFILPCSRMGHIFRKRRPYSSPSDSGLRNSVRVAQVWLDDYKEEFYKNSPRAQNFEYGDISSRLKLRKNLDCKPFKWYLENIYPEMIQNSSSGSPDKKEMVPWKKRARNYVNSFQINLAGSKLCVGSEKDVTTKNSGLILTPCQTWNKKQRWSQTDKNELILAELLCLDGNNNKLRLGKCHEMRGTQEWTISSKVESGIYNPAAGLCVSLSHKNEKIIEGARLSLEICSEESWMKFNLISYRKLI